MAIFRKFIPIGFFFLFVVCAGCSTKEANYLPSQAQQQFLKISSEEYNLSPVLKTAGKTLWVYLPLDQEILSIKAGQNQSTNSASVAQFSVQYINGKLDDKNFLFEYDIIPVTRSSANNSSITTVYTEEFTKSYQNILSTIGRVYFNTQQPPDFIVLVIADIRNGLEVKNTFLLEDFKKYQTQILPYEEYIQRVLTESSGNPLIKDDKQGDHLGPQDIIWPNFLAQQIVNRIKFKYTQSDFKPQNAPSDEIIKIAAHVIQTYQFEDFLTVELRDLRQEKSYSFGKSLINEIKE
ncbi:MAG: hypothetical protein WC676_02720 [Candidatus Omnitrophota bacterium]